MLLISKEDFETELEHNNPEPSKFSSMNIPMYYMNENYMFNIYINGDSAIGIAPEEIIDEDRLFSKNKKKNERIKDSISLSASSFFAYLQISIKEDNDIYKLDSVSLILTRHQGYKKLFTPEKIKKDKILNKKTINIENKNIIFENTFSKPIFYYKILFNSGKIPIVRDLEFDIVLYRKENQKKKGCYLYLKMTKKNRTKKKEEEAKQKQTQGKSVTKAKQKQTQGKGKAKPMVIELISDDESSVIDLLSDEE